MKYSRVNNLGESNTNGVSLYADISYYLVSRPTPEWRTLENVTREHVYPAYLFVTRSLRYTIISIHIRIVFVGQRYSTVISRYRDSCFGSSFCSFANTRRLQHGVSAARKSVNVYLARDIRSWKYSNTLITKRDR